VLSTENPITGGVFSTSVWQVSDVRQRLVLPAALSNGIRVKVSGSRVSVSDPVFDPVLSFNKRGHLCDSSAFLLMDFLRAESTKAARTMVTSVAILRR